MQAIREAQEIRITVGQNHGTQTLFENKVLNISFSLSNNCIESEKQNGCMDTECCKYISTAYSQWRMDDWELWLLLRSVTGKYLLTLYISSTGQDHSSKPVVKFLLNAYHFCLIEKLKSHVN